MISGKRSLSALAFLAFSGAGLALFYARYVPLTASYQAALAPVLALAAIAAFVDPRRGTFLFILLFPLVNNLPYFFKLYEPLPQAPAALVLFLFYFLGWTAARLFRGEPVSLAHPVLKSLGLFAALVLLSGLVAFWRYADFAPFLGDRIYELVTNAHGVTAGGALMSIVFSSLNYLTAFAFLLALSHTLESGKDLRPVLACVLVSASISLAFGFFQHFGNPTLGNNPLSIAGGLVNATFKDAMSFGAFLAMVIPLLVGIVFACKGLPRIWSFLVLLAAGAALLMTGSKSGLLSLPVALGVFAVLNAGSVRGALRPGKLSWKTLHGSTKTVAAIVIVLFMAAVVFRGPLVRSLSKSKTVSRIPGIFAADASAGAVTGRTKVLWKLALSMIRDYPLTGIGTGAYIIEVSNYAKAQSIPLATPESAENSILQIGAELGLAGVGLAFWVLLAFLGQIRRSLAASPAGSGSRFLVSGAAAGITAYILITQAHTFIGSYEITYLFGLLAGIVIAAGVPGEARPEKPRTALRRRIGTVSGFALFGILLLWNSTHSLSLGSRTEEFGLVQDFGFHRIEKTDDGREYRWTGKYGGTSVTIAKPFVEIPLQASHPGIGRNPVRVRIRLITRFFREKRTLGEALIRDNNWKTFSWPVQVEPGRKAILLIEVDRTWNPGKVLGAPDSRDLGVAVGTIRFVDTPSF